MKEGQNEPKKDSLWLKTQYANLIRYKSSGIYFARFRVRGKLIWKSLKTDRISVAKLRLSDLEKMERERSATLQAQTSGRMTFGQAAEIYLKRIDANASLKPRTKDYHHERVEALQRAWPALHKLDIHDISEADCQKWAEEFGAGMSATAFNHTLGIFRAVIEIGIKAGARYDNPAKNVSRMRETPKKLQLPEPDQFDQFVRAIETSGSGFSRPCAELVRFLAFGGFRISEAKHVTWTDCDFVRGRIRVNGDPETGLKGRTAGEIRDVPMIPEMRQLLEGMRSRRSDEPAESSVMRVNECQKAMDSAAKKVGMARITHHDLRHLFATRCIESGVDIPTVSRWLGHKDGGALAMRVYGHIRDEHSTAMAQKVSFIKPAAVTANPKP